MPAWILPALGVGALAGAVALVKTGHVLPFIPLSLQGKKSALPANKPVTLPPPPAAALNQPEYQPAPGIGYQIFQSFNPDDHSVAQNVRALRFLGITAIIPSDVQGDPLNSDYQDAVKTFQQFANMTPTGIVDEATQVALSQQVASKNAVLHNQNVASNNTDLDWVTEQNKLGAADERGAWSVSGYGSSASGKGRQTLIGARLKTPQHVPDNTDPVFAKYNRGQHFAVRGTQGKGW